MNAASPRWIAVALLAGGLFSVVASGNPGAAQRNPVLVERGQATSAFAPESAGAVAAVAAAGGQAGRPSGASPARASIEPSVVRVGQLRQGAYVVVTLPLETYVSRVVAGEAAMGSSPVALEVMAITIRTFALANRTRHRADGFDLCDQTHCQVLRAATAKTDGAARGTAGQVLLRGGVPASVYYSASCGGRTERPSAVWPGAEDPSYLPSRTDSACGGSPAWAADLTLVEMQRALAAAGFRGKLRAVSVGARSESGRVAVLRLEGVEPREISGQDLRVAVGRTMGWQHLKSTAFDVRKVGNAYRFTGHGSGHGVGLCVIGAAHLAATGQSASAILGRYFPGLEIGSAGPRIVAAPKGPTVLPPPPVRAPEVVGAPTAPAVRGANAAMPTIAPTVMGPGAIPAQEVLVSLPDEDEGERVVIASLTGRVRDDVARTLGVPAPPRVTLRFHPTTTEYERATGQRWFTASALVGAEAHFVPLASLRDRGVLERTIAREVVHLMTDPVLARRPAWVREGAALFFADSSSGAASAVVPDARSPGPRVLCPVDAELQQPVSAGALAEAFARARACFARQVVAGKSWRDVK